MLDENMDARLKETRSALDDIEAKLRKDPYNLELGARHRELLKKFSSLESKVIPAVWDLTADPVPRGVQIYKVDLNLARISSLRSFPPAGESPFTKTDVPEDAPANARWECISLSANVNSIRVVHNIGHFEHLRELNLRQNHITELAEGGALKNLHRLRSLDVSANCLTAIEGLSTLTNLRHLNLSSNMISAIGTGLERLSRLTSLSLAGNNIIRVLGMKALAEVTSVDLSRNKLLDITHLAFCRSIEKLKVSNNNLRDLDLFTAALLPLDRLKSLHIEGNPLCDARDCKLRVLENTSIFMLDEVEIKPYLRKHLQDMKRKTDLEEIVDLTTKDYIARVETERESKMRNLEALRERERELENAFNTYREEMEGELQECISYINGLDLRSDVGKREQLATEEGIARLRAKLEFEEEKRRREREAFEHSQRASTINGIVRGSGVVKYTEKLMELSRSSQPSGER